MSLCDERPKAGTTTRIVAVFVGSDGSLLTGLTPTIRIRRASDGSYLQDDGSWASTPASDDEMTEVSATHLAGVYEFDFAVPSEIDEYFVRCDGGETAANRCVDYCLESVSVSEADLAARTLPLDFRGP